VSRPTLGSQAADSAAWDEVRAAISFALAEVDGQQGPANYLEDDYAAGWHAAVRDETVDALTAAVTPVLVRLVDQAVEVALHEGATAEQERRLKSADNAWWTEYGAEVRASAAADCLAHPVGVACPDVPEMCSDQRCSCCARSVTGGPGGSTDDVGDR
jgi:hypothetical protein